MVDHRLALVVLLGAMAMPGLVWAEQDEFSEDKMPKARVESSSKQYTTNTFARLDADGDDRISVEEAAHPLPEPFEILDSNQDGYLSEKEYLQVEH